MFTVNSPLRWTNSRVPSSGSTTQSVLQLRRVAHGSFTASSDSTGISGEMRFSPARISFSERRSASVSGDMSSFLVTVKVGRVNVEDRAAGFARERGDLEQQAVQVGGHVGSGKGRVIS